MKEFPEFMKNTLNHIDSKQQNTPDIDGYYYEGKDGSQICFWTYSSNRDSKENIHAATVSVELDFDDLMKQFTDIVANIPGSSDPKGDTEEGIKFREYWQPRICQIIEKYLGKGKKIKDASRDQAEAVDLIVADLKELVKG